MSPSTDVRLPPPLRPGDTIGVTAPSSGVPAPLRPRLELAVERLRARGYDVVLGDCLDGEGAVSAPAADRAAELTAMLTDPAVRAVVPPWGGVLAIDLLDRLDWDALAAAEPTWFVGYSDCSTILLPLLTRLGWAGVHGANLMDSPYDPPAELAHWTEVAARPATLTQVAPGRHRGAGHDRWEDDPTYTSLTLDTPGDWEVVGADGAEGLDVTGRLVGGCVEVLGPLAGTPYGDVAAFGRAYAADGLVVLVEASGDDAPTIGRHLHGMRLAGWFEHARAVLVGRTRAPAADGVTQREAVVDALGGLGVPLVLDVDCGHVPPWTPLVTGAPTRVVATGERREITQTLA